jgi:hypothetical protein
MALSKTGPHDLLAVYLRDHHASGRAGVALARRAAEDVDASVAPGGELAVIAHEVAEDLVTLEMIMEAVGITPSSAKDALAAVGERVGRLKGNGRVFERSPLSDVVELETLVAGIRAKEALWQSLSLATGSEPGLDIVDLERLIERARRQGEVVELCRQEAARIAFGVAVNATAA